MCISVHVLGCVHVSDTVYGVCPCAWVCACVYVSIHVPGCVHVSVCVPGHVCGTAVQVCGAAAILQFIKEAVTLPLLARQLARSLQGSRPSRNDCAELQSPE